MKYLYIKHIEATAEIEAKDDIEAKDIGRALEDSYFDIAEFEDMVEEI